MKTRAKTSYCYSRTSIQKHRAGRSWVHILRLNPVPSVGLNRLDALQVKTVQGAQVERSDVALGGPEVLSPLGQRGDLVVGQGVQVGKDVGAARLAKRFAPDLVGEGVVGQILTALDGELLLRGVYPDECALVSVSELKCVALGKVLEHTRWQMLQLHSRMGSL